MMILMIEKINLKNYKLNLKVLTNQKNLKKVKLKLKELEEKLP